MSRPTKVVGVYERPDSDKRVRALWIVAVVVVVLGVLVYLWVRS